MTADNFWTHLEIVASVVIPLGSGIVWLIWNAARQNLKVDLMWLWYTNHGSDLTGYKPGDEFKGRGNVSKTHPGGNARRDREDS